MSKQQLWGGRFTGATDPLMVAYNESLSYDQKMYKEDIEGSKVYAAALCKVGILTSEELKAIEDGLDKVGAEWNAGSFKAHPSDEDIHTANERRLGEIIGRGIAGKLHTGRSRNDQVATDMRLWLTRKIDDMEETILNFIRAIVARAENEVEFLMPGYTHLQVGWIMYVFMILVL